MEVQRKTSEERADALEESMMRQLDKAAQPRGVRRGTGLLFGGLRTPFRGSGLGGLLDGLALGLPGGRGGGL